MKRENIIEIYESVEFRELFRLYKSGNYYKFVSLAIEKYTVDGFSDLISYYEFENYFQIKGCVFEIMVKFRWYKGKNSLSK
ncbi:hypothetical protein [uncultured Arcobacter sp.]|uniref:hypothetical protein n=1 Tax=uncultured Arcobacter sp. TaxID=165434 RepID=UPI002616D08D|nr:hypothetical protein [uncultured Arcobacter sp.]